MFVVFEGIDGSGKTTISNRVAAELTKEGLQVMHLRADGRFVSPVSEGIREFGRNAQNLDLSWQAEFLLYVARDVQLLHEALRPALTQHDLVLADRFLYTPEVLARHGRGLEESFVRPILTAAADGLQPDLVILVDVDPTFARARRKLRKLGDAGSKPPARKGLAGVGLQQRLRRGYLALAEQDPSRWVVLRNEASLEAGVERALNLIRAACQLGAPRAIETFQAEVGREAPRSTVRLETPEQALSAFLGRIDELCMREPKVAAYLLSGMFGPAIDERRQRLLPSAADALLAGLVDLSDDASFAFRRELARAKPKQVLRSLGAARATAAGAVLWQELESLAPAEALACLSGADDELSWRARDAWFEAEPALRDAIVGGLGGLDHVRAWELRERALSGREDELGRSYELSRLAAKSVASLGSERAWQLRERCRRLAPVAALASLGSLVDPLSWQWRSHALRKAPKVVMATLKGCTAAKAWEMRHAVVMDCKEAVDGFQGSDSPEAWELRDRAEEVWPSTVVKSLGALAAGPRGKALVHRLLDRHPDNVSLLKHASSIALGHHLSASPHR